MSNHEGLSPSNSETTDDNPWAELQMLGDGSFADDFENVDEERERQVDEYAEYIRGNKELSEEEAARMHVFDDDIFHLARYGDCWTKLRQLIAPKVNKFVERIKKEGNYGVDERDISLSEQHEIAERLLNISAEDFDALFQDSSTDSDNENVTRKDWANGRQALFAFMRGELPLTRQQAAGLFYQHTHLLQPGNQFTPYYPAVTAMFSVRGPWEERYRAKNEQSLLLYEKVYMTDDKTTRETVKPFVESVKEDEEKLMELIASIDIEHATTEQIQKIVDFFAEKFGLGEDAPEVIIKEKIEDGSRGTYRDIAHTMELSMGRFSSIADLINTIAHEIWHAHQHRTDSEAYRYNESNYIFPQVNYDMYQNQIMEKEAFEMGRQIGDTVRMAYLKAHPERVPRMAMAYRFGAAKHMRGDLDEGYYRLAYEMQRKPKPHRGFRPKTSFFGGFLGFRNKKKDDYE